MAQDMDVAWPSRLTGTLLGVVIHFVCVANAQLPAQYTLSPTKEQIHPMQDDASLNEVKFVGEKNGWAVGDRGTVWKSTDGGQSWNLIPTVADVSDYSFQSVCFLTDQVGWIAGGTIDPVSGQTRGLVLKTQDGGKSWSIVASQQLNYVNTIRFFDFDHGIVVGERSIDAPAGIFATEDSGQNWTAVNATSNARWNDGAFFDMRNGLVVGPLGQQSILANGTLTFGNATSSHLQSLNDINIDSNGNAWLAGDGGLVLSSSNRGVSWEIPESDLPREFKKFTDFQGVAQLDSKIWIVGSPGSVVWHSPDAGKSWTPQATNDTTPLTSVHFVNETDGVAVGVLGRISRTTDGGETWYPVRGADRRVASWSIHAYTSRTPIEFLNRWSGESGYRTATTILTRSDVGPDAHADDFSNLRLKHAVLKSGGNTSEIQWSLPLEIPGLKSSQPDLIKEWTSIHDQQLPQIVLGSLVARIRTYRPDMILLDEAPKEDATTELLQNAIMTAIQQAADPSRYPEHRLAGLPVWQVKKVVMQRAPGSQGHFTQDAFEVLPNLGTTLDIASANAKSLLETTRTSQPHPVSYDVIWSASDSGNSRSSLFGDLQIPIGTAARRELPAVRKEIVDELIAQSQHRRHISSVSQHAIQSETSGGQLIGQLGSMMRPLTKEQAARQLADLALEFRRNGEWDLAEQVYAQLLQDYSSEPCARQSILWLIPFWTSSELGWQRLKSISAEDVTASTDRSIFRANFQYLSELSERLTTPESIEEDLTLLQNPSTQTSQPRVPTIGNSPMAVLGNSDRGRQDQMRQVRWQELAGTVSEAAIQSSPQLNSVDDLQFTLAALYRKTSKNKKADAIYNRYLQRLNPDDPWYVAAQGEASLLKRGAISPKPMLNCKLTSFPPVLDGDLTDACWSEAMEVPLDSSHEAEAFIGTEGQSRGRPRSSQLRPIAFFSHDEEYFYFAIRIPKHPEIPYAETQSAGRPRDGSLERFDRISIQIDTDRDYSTFYEFEVDQRGWTRERCWEDLGFDPNWFVATSQDSESWSVEAAIPLEELAPPELTFGQTWAVGVTRIVPAKQVQTWTGAGGEIPLAPRFGLMNLISAPVTN
ncbi:Ycf48-like protein precursor [Thalassoglobus neptunius]|uniref:Ycf48-like protein n=1 Tax=Thalassoglobus neptunius TaxID=1938619 RepID=A0A5C5WIQ0_9PLAN|nr:YCF48-related protein [Thalassoglobus neptunius]TWT49903.1 Ycf48-like protein precursor [Thalassoglobus neptunius]